MTMPVMTGINVATELFKVNPRIPVILCTGYSEMITEAQAKQMGIREFLMKPISMKTLANAVRAALDMKHPA
jgi:two-component system cell cycle sensor histidine kinase/response regulator CckA